jgi:putative hydrolase of the HAD superfamily
MRKVLKRSPNAAYPNRNQKILVSIDMWGTLVKSSPSFTEAKLELTKRFFPIYSEFIVECYTQTKKQLNDIIEITGFQPSDEIIFKLLFSKLNNGFSDFKFLKKFVNEYQKTALQNPPELYSEETIEYIEKLTILSLNKLIISSNTMFISGDTLRKILKIHNIYHFFRKCYFSDEMKVSKPNENMYGRSKYHIGDNALTDEVGARCANSIPIIINSNGKTIKDAYDCIIQRDGI